MAALGIFGFILLLGVGALQIYLGFLGIEHYFGWLTAVAAVLAAFVLRLLLPLTVGSYFGAVVVLGWPWYVGLLVAAPGLLFVIPSAITSALETVFSRQRDE